MTTAKTTRAAVIIAPTDDVHALAVQREAHLQDTPCHISDFATLGRDWTLSFTADGRLYWQTDSGDSVEPLAVWWRRPAEPEVATFIAHEDVREFARRSSITLAVGALQAVVHRHVNPMQAEQRLNRKPYQLWLANQVGLATPNTLVTNDPDQARSFVREGNNVFKTLATWRYDMKETRMVTPEVIDDLESIRLCPVILQRFVDGMHEARVTVVGDDVFVAVADLEPDGYQTDARYYHDRMGPGVLPNHIIDGLQRFHRRAGLIYGAYDLRQNSNGEWVFLEVNPAGQFLFVEIQTGHPISAAIACQLSVNCPPDMNVSSGV